MTRRIDLHGFASAGKVFDATGWTYFFDYTIAD